MCSQTDQHGCKALHERHSSSNLHSAPYESLANKLQTPLPAFVYGIKTLGSLTGHWRPAGLNEADVSLRPRGKEEQSAQYIINPDTPLNESAIGSGFPALPASREQLLGVFVYSAGLIYRKNCPLFLSERLPPTHAQSAPVTTVIAAAMQGLSKETVAVARMVWPQ
ncbi:hypothetical protein Q8A67_018086 [Cirrhinus molitorella]|uniref:Uncharacterized protein n=1 Tax=Cirrhinus molitorella TaxID=172907 RepID=A0AA88PMW9_9TELE|nr:hypothetical protein Q8A67_018086 [Cirrhinus molitorella]